MPEICKACGKTQPGMMATVVMFKPGEGHICDVCRTEAVSQYIAAREAEKPKAPTLESDLVGYLHGSTRMETEDRAREIIAMVREHDSAQDMALWRNHK